MFWRFGGYAHISPIDNILDKPDFTLEDLLEEVDLLQEVKAHNSRLIDYLREEQTLEKLLDYVVAPVLEPVTTPAEEDAGRGEKGKGLSFPFTRSRTSSKSTDDVNNDDDELERERKRTRYASVASEILCSSNWSICATLLDSLHLLRNFWLFLKRPAPLDPLQAGYFTKVNESLFDKKVEDMVDFVKSLDDVVSDILHHVDSPMIMDLLLKIITLDKIDPRLGIVEWLYVQDLIPKLLSFLGPEHTWTTQSSVGDFIKALITVSASASQNEQTCIGPNELTRQLVSMPYVEQLIKHMLRGGETLTTGVGIVIEVIRKNNSDYDPDIGTDAYAVPSARDPIYLGTLLRLFAEHVPDFMKIMADAPAQHQRLTSTFGPKIEPLGFDRFKTCELMAELLHCSNMALLNELGADELIAARDHERQRLRAEGRLMTPRDDDIASSADELTMRMSHSPSADQPRRLEVTNISGGDDDFEEVSHRDEESVDDLVKAEEEDMPELPAASGHESSGPYLIDRDEVDFVDEPLTSPQTRVREIIDPDSDHDFDHPLPLFSTADQTSRSSPSHSSSQPSPEPTPPTAHEDGGLGMSRSTNTPATGQSEELKANGETHRAQPELEAADAKGASRPAAPAVVDVMAEAAHTSIDEQHASIASNPPPTVSEDSAKVIKHHAPPDIAQAPHSPSRSTLEGQRWNGEGERPAAGDSGDTQEFEQEFASPFENSSVPHPGSITTMDEASIIVGHSLDQDANSSACSIRPSQPVVGDFLKMQFVEHRVVPTILSFFFAYPWNNFLHNVVYDIVQQVFNGPMDRGYNPVLAISLFEHADITAQIIRGQKASEESEQQTKTRMGYMGHLTLIAEEVVKFTERHPPELLSERLLERVMAEDWIHYVEGPLADTRQRDNAILGGVRPEVTLSNRAMAANLAGLGGLSSIGLGGGGSHGGSLSALAEVGLNGNIDDGQDAGASHSAGPFAVSAGTLMSSLGSSSDEEEDGDMDHEDVTNEFRAYTDSLNQGGLSNLNPPSLPPPPPPPPPLNIPPSRARLQFAARLAMSKREAEEAAAAAAAEREGAEAQGSADGSIKDGRADNHMEDLEVPEPLSYGRDAGRRNAGGRMRNPFADADDEDDDDDDDDDKLSDEDVTERDAGLDEVDYSSSSWSRGSWWRGVVQSARRGNRKSQRDSAADERPERFGDGRDDSDDESDGDMGDEDEDDDEDDEEFGDFAMPEGVSSSHGSDDSRPSGTATDSSADKILLMPLAVRPSTKVGPSQFSNIWPFNSSTASTSNSYPALDADSAAVEGRTPLDGVDESRVSSRDGAGQPAASAGAQAAASMTESGKPAHANATIATGTATAPDAGASIINDDGSRVSRAVEAQRRTSIEDPDDEED